MSTFYMQNGVLYIKKETKTNHTGILFSGSPHILLTHL